MKKFFKFLLPISFLVVGLAISLSVLAQTNAPAPSGDEIKNITFPIPELGNCAGKESCRLYCEKPENAEACIAFAKNNGLMEKDEASRAEKYIQGIKGGNGPGGCADAKSCETFCSNVNNLDTCLAWSDKNNIKDKNFDEAKKIQSFVKSGGQMPGGCTSKKVVMHIATTFHTPKNVSPSPKKPAWTLASLPAQMEIIPARLKTVRHPSKCLSL